MGGGASYGVGNAETSNPIYLVRYLKMTLRFILFKILLWNTL